MKKTRCGSGEFSVGNRILSRLLLLFSIMVLFVASVSSAMAARLPTIGGGGGNCAPGYKPENYKCVKIEEKPIEETPAEEVPEV